MTTHLNRERRIAGALFNNSNTTRACGLADGARTRGHSLLAVLAIALPLVVAVQVHAQGGGGGNVLPPGANSHGYSLDQMTKLMAFFDTSGNNPLYYPKTPFQILATPFGNPNNPTFTAITCPQPPGGTGTSLTGGNTFVVKSGTPFFVPIWQFDDSPPYISPFPAKASEAGDYVFAASPMASARGTRKSPWTGTPLLSAHRIWGDRWRRPRCRTAAAHTTSCSACS